MKKSGMGKRLFLFILTAAIILTMQDFSVLAGQVPLENGTGSQPEVTPESQPEQPGDGTSAEQPVEPPQPESQPEQSTEQPDSGDRTPDGAQGETPETPAEQPPQVEGETQGKTPETSSEQPMVPEADNPEILLVAPENNFTTEANADLDGAAGMSLGLDAGTLAAHTVPSQNPGQAVVNLFDYWQYSDDKTNEVSHDYWEDDNSKTDAVTTYNIGISKGHLLRFGYREINPDGTKSKCLYCYDNGNYGDWNQYRSSGPREGIVKNILGADGFPHLNLVKESDYGAYAEPDNSGVYLTDKTKNESLDYLFSPNVDVVDSKGKSVKASYTNVQGLFQMDNNGYYYYDSTKNFAELDTSNPGSPHFILYDSPGAADSQGHYGQFFPFNKAGEVFDEEYTASNGKVYLNYIDKANNENSDEDYKPVWKAGNVGFIQCYAPGLNHYLGMTLEVPFLQPVGGQLPNKEAMSFKFSGDDDVWIFIDDVLVADLGGLHDACSLKIDFATGDVYVQDMDTPHHTLLESFRDAYPGNASSWNPGGVAFAPNTGTFADNTVHTLKMFYLERGNIASNLSLSFNLQTARYNQIKKVDQNGNAMENVEFALYPAVICNAEDNGSILCNSTVDKTSGGTCYVKQNGETPLLTLRTGSDGIANFSNYTFSPDTQYYILHETAPPAGYRSQPVDIVLEYNSQTTMLSVANRWETGAYASFTSYVSEQAGVQLIYGQYNANTGLVEKGTGNVPDGSRENGLILAVPMLQRGNSTVWLPLYGSNLDGFHTTGVEGADEGSMKRALLTAALNQCLYNESWYLEWNPAKNILEGSLSDLPGRADRYRHENANGDMQMAYIIIEPAALAQITGGAGNSTERYAALKQYVAANGVNAAVNAIYDGNAGADVRLLDTAQFIRVFRSLIYISNEQRELRVMKVDENGQPLNGAQFGLYASIDDAQQNRNAAAVGVTANVDGMDGLLIFKPQTNGEPGYARMVWADAPEQQYYLKEISAPKGYSVNETLIPVVVGIYSIYADAGSAGDGVSVMAGAGQLYRTMAKYASDGDVNITLRDITVTAQRQDSGQFVLDGWQDMNESGQKQEKNLHYGMNGEMGMDYGLHDEDLGSTPFFRTETGFLRVRVSQNTQALQDELYNGAVNIANWDNLGDTDLTGLFSLLNIVVVEDRKAKNTDGNGDYEDDPEMTDTDTAEVKASPKGLDVLVERIGTPQTGDDSLMWWWASLGIISLVGIGATVCNLIVVKKKQKRYSPKEAKKKHSVKK